MRSYKNELEALVVFEQKHGVEPYYVTQKQK